MYINRKLILIIPVFNGEKILSATFNKLDNFFCNNKYLKKIIFVDDGSSDKTAELLLNYKKTSNLNIDIIRNNKNIGKGGSIKKAVSNICNYADVIIFVDADLPYGLISVEEIMKKMSADSTIDLIIGNRNLIKDKRQYSKYRYLFKKIFTIFLPSKVRNYTDTQSGIKGFNEKIATNFNIINTNEWCFDIELLLIAINNNFKIVEIPVKINELKFFGGVSLLKHGFYVLRDLYKIRNRNKKKLYKIK